MIKANVHKYSVSAMCRVLQISRATYYYEAKAKPDNTKITAAIRACFIQSRNNYGTRKIKRELAKDNLVVSRRKIGKIMKQEGLVSNYTVAQFKPQRNKCNEAAVENVVNREFTKQSYRNVVVSDLTYVRVGMSWNYICVLIDLFNREIIGYSAGCHKNSDLVKAAFKVLKTEFIWNETFDTLDELKLKLWDYVNWYNHHRLHSSLDYQTPVSYRKNALKKVV